MAWKRSRKGIAFASAPLFGAFASYPEYNRAIIADLHSYFDTSHCLVQQADGFVLRPELWSDEFLQYDYIGATMWSGVVGNGGFSLRSKAFCEATAEIDLSVRHYDKLTAFGVQEQDFENEDMRLLVEYELPSHLKIAPPEVADRFSWELSPKRPKPLQSFGFHGKHTMEALRNYGLL